MKPVVCGRALLMRKSITGYDDPKLWCNTPEIVLQQRDLVVKPATDRLDENLKHMVRIPVPGWHLKERPAWILRFTMPRLSQILMRLRGDDGTFQRRTSKDDPSGLRFAYMEIRGDKVYAVNQEIHTESRDTRVDSEGRGTLAMRIGEDGTPQYFQGPGWPANPFSSELKFEFGQGDQARWRWNVDKNRPFIPWQYTKEGSAENAVEIWLARDFHANRLPTLNNFLMIRGRETSPQ
ncbi:MAG: hypothetical protein EOP85_20445 [Verrucomicrobiaceae bacterium]|nr:MAG: hypothetical protein EOP85_20445 [Verrucomicrobiaceae bacterium]